MPREGPQPVDCRALDNINTCNSSVLASRRQPNAASPGPRAMAPSASTSSVRRLGSMQSHGVCDDEPLDEPLDESRITPPATLAAGLGSVSGVPSISSRRTSETARPGRSSPVSESERLGPNAKRGPAYGTRPRRITATKRQERTYSNLTGDSWATVPQFCHCGRALVCDKGPRANRTDTGEIANPRPNIQTPFASPLEHYG